MKKLYALFLFISIGAVSANAATKVVKHTIKKGETLYTVAHKHHSTIEEVRKLNGITNGEILKIGRVVKVPTNTYFPKKKQKIAKSKIKSKVAKTVKHKIKIVKAVKKHKKS
ncbi:MAG TPA: LysM domain-containing protein, partial [Epsilonproteobacteria bacterium]|nr:LysM domain-containing protein [Campylobacterota bacterium]